jgi:hypothetical protein
MTSRVEARCKLYVQNIEPVLKYVHHVEQIPKNPPQNTRILNT